MRPSLLFLAFTLAIAAPPAPAQDARLPDIGSSAGELLTPARQAEYGGMVLRELRNYGYLLEDPLLDEWLQSIGSRLGADSDRQRQLYTFFLLKDRQINAFAALGGYIGMNAGLILTAEREDEVAAVLSHEIAHVTQQHVLRSVERAQRDQIPILLGMLGAIVLAQAAGGTSSGDASQAAIASGLGLMQQRQIDYTRSNESEADRVGIQTLARTGYDVDAMAGFFERMAQVTRGNRGDAFYSTPDYLRTHPVNATRISEARQRAEQIARENSIPATSSTPTGSLTQRVPRDTDYSSGGGSGNPMLPGFLQLPQVRLSKGGSGEFDWARERLRVLSADNATAALREYGRLADSGAHALSDAQRYGRALARLYSNDAAGALADLQPLLDRHPGNRWVALATAQAEARSGRVAAANQRFAALLQQSPHNRAVALAFAGALNEQGDAAAGRRAQAVLRPLVGSSGDDPVFQQSLARAHELAGDTVRAGEAYAEAAYLNGRAEQALIQLQNLKRREDLDYYARARIDSRIAVLTPQVLELRRQGIRDPDVQRR
ncbi:MAG TPA: M48 family metalloprotease [Pseudoxanthomonas sp.]|nr:M48 family metalloprotease [Pseudoxanthomonas sp.]